MIVIISYYVLVFLIIGYHYRYHFTRLMSILHAFDYGFRHNIVKVAANLRGDSHRTIGVTAAVIVVDTFHYFLNQKVINLS